MPRNFYTRPTLVVAKDLLGKFIIRKWRGQNIVGKIVETEAYIGPRDKASHAYSERDAHSSLAYKGKITSRNKAEYLVGGHIYIYLVYGMYWQFNISTSFEGRPECVLIRALEPVDKEETGFCCASRARCHSEGVSPKNLKEILRSAQDDMRKRLFIPNGPGKLCNYLKVDKSFYGEDLTKSKKVRLEDSGEKIKKSDIISAKRIGIDYAQEWASKLWRFYIKDNLFVSKR